MKRLSNRKIKLINKKNMLTGFFLLLTTWGILCVIRRSIRGKLNREDRKIAKLYAKIYNVPFKEVVALKMKKRSWDEINQQLLKRRYFISNNKKSRMQRDGYALKDLEEAERLSIQTGYGPYTLIQEKGKTREGKAWNDVLDELGLVKENYKS